MGPLTSVAKPVLGRPTGDGEQRQLRPLETGAWYRRRSEARGGHRRLSLQVPVTLVQTVPRCGQGLSTPSPGANSTPHVKTPCRFLQGLCPLPEMRRCVSNFCFFKTGTSHVKPCPSPVWSSRCFSKMLPGRGGGREGPEESSVLARIIESATVKHLCSFCPARLSCFPAK